MNATPEADSVSPKSRPAGRRGLIALLGTVVVLAGGTAIWWTLKPTTPHFVEFFGMNSMTDLPTLREFTELSAEHRELFKAKTGEIPDLSSEPSPIAEASEEGGFDDNGADAGDDEDAIDTVAEVEGEERASDDERIDLDAGPAAISERSELEDE